MNPRRLLLAIMAGFLFVWLSDFLIHGIWLKHDYTGSPGLWRPAAEMQAHLGWVMLAELLAVVTFTVLYAKGFAEKACRLCAVMFGLFMALFSQANTLVAYAVQPIPGSLAVKWFIAASAQGVLLGLIIFSVYKPKPCDAQAGDDCK